jgi:hypothetical protein
VWESVLDFEDDDRRKRRKRSSGNSGRSSLKYFLTAYCVIS